MRKRVWIFILCIALFLSSYPLYATSATYSSSNKKIAAGSNHSVALHNDGTVWAWGDNTYGQVLGEIIYGENGRCVTSARRVLNIKNVISVDAGVDFSVALKKDGTVWTWGSTYGEKSVKQVEGLFDVIAIAAGSYHFMALKSDGTVWTDESEQVQILNNVIAIATGGGHYMALKKDGTVWTWGYNNWGQLGVDSTYTSTPAQVQSLNNVIAIAAGEDHSMALKNDGTVWTWGKNNYGQLGDGSANENSNCTPVKAQDLNNVIKIDAGIYCCMALKSDGTVWTWGRTNISVILDSKLFPVQANENLNDIIAIAAGDNHCMALKSDGTILTWGNNTYGQLGIGTYSNYYDRVYSGKVRKYNYFENPIYDFNIDENTVCYDGNGSMDDLPSQTEKYNTIFKLSDTIPYKPGYSFLGWSLSRDATAATYYPGDDFSLNADTTLYAVWRENPTRTVTYNLNGGKRIYNTQFNTQSELEGLSVQLSSGSPIKDGYSFSGWLATGAVSGIFQPGDWITMGRGDITLTAQWEVNTYTVSFNSNGGSYVEKKTADYATTINQPPSPTKSGYAFTGWYTKPDGGVKVEFPYTVTTSTTLYAHWQAAYEVKFDGNGGVGVPINSVVAYGAVYTIPVSTPSVSVPGYSFAGWFASGSVSGVYFPGETFVMGSGDVLLKAGWAQNTTQYTVSYDANGGIGAPESQVKNQGIDLTLSTQIPIRSGYTFLGWSTSSTATIATYLPGSNFTIERNTILFAVWKPVSVTVEDSCDGGADCPGYRYKDMPDVSNWAHSGIDFAVSNGLFAGTSANTFSPWDSMTRAMMVTVLWRMDGMPKTSSNNSFSDVADGTWFTEAIIWAADNHIVDGVGNGKFEPDGNITREQMATILYRYAAWKNYDTSAKADLSVFPDYGRVSRWAKEAISWANATELIAGTREGNTIRLAPSENATRAQVATIFMRFANNFAR